MLGTGCATNPHKLNRQYVSTAISRVDEFYSGKTAEEFKQAYRDVQKLSPEEFKKSLDLYNSNESWFLGQVGHSEKELKELLFQENEKTLNPVNKVIIVGIVKEIWDAIEKATHHATNPGN